MPIDRKRVRELAEKPWNESYAALASIAAAKTVEEFSRFEPRFNRAYRTLKGHVLASKQNPLLDSPADSHRATADGQALSMDGLRPLLKDRDLGRALGSLVDMVDANALLHDAARAPRAYEIGQKLIRLRGLGWVYVRRGTDLQKPTGHT